MKPKFTTDFPEAVSREGAEAQVFRAHADNSINALKLLANQHKYGDSSVEVLV